MSSGVEAARRRRSARRGDGGRLGLRPRRGRGRRCLRRGVPRKQRLGSAVVRRLLGERAWDRPRAAEPGQGSPAAARPRGVHLPGSDHGDRRRAAARDRGAQGVTHVENNAVSPSHASGRPRLAIRHRPSSSGKRGRPGRVDPPVRRARRARLLCVAVAALGPLASTCRLAWQRIPCRDQRSNHRRRQAASEIDGRGGGTACSDAPRFGRPRRCGPHRHRDAGRRLRWRVLGRAVTSLGRRRPRPGHRLDRA